MKICKYVLFFGSEFSRHPEGLSFSGPSFRDTRGSEFFGSEFSRHPEGLSFRETPDSRSAAYENQVLAAARAGVLSKE